MDVKYPQVQVRLTGINGNALAIIGAASTAAKRAGVSKEEIDTYQEEAMSGDYDNVLVTTMSWFECN